jgi:hypothetical protein
VLKLAPLLFLPYICKTIKQIEIMTATFGQFELKGFDVDYFIDGKYMGSMKIEKQDREVFGYYGRKYHVAETDLIINKGRKTSKIKKGTEYYTELQALCGKTI